MAKIKRSRKAPGDIGIADAEKELGMQMDVDVEGSGEV